MRKQQERTRFLRRAEPWLHLCGGLALAPLFALLPVLSHMGWFLASLAHEMGHCAVAWLFGQPAVPAIRLDGHAAAVHGNQSLVLCLMILAALLSATWKLVDARWGRTASRARRMAVPAGLALLYVALGFTGAREVLFLFAGHAGELVFASIFLWRALEPGFSRFPVERTLYAALGWLLVGRNLFLSLGLVSSAAKRAAYAENGSFGMTNDYLRLADDVLGVPLISVATLMVVASVLAPLLAIGGWKLHSHLLARGSETGQAPA